MTGMTEICVSWSENCIVHPQVNISHIGSAYAERMRTYYLRKLPYEYNVTASYEEHMYKPKTVDEHFAVCMM